MQKAQDYENSHEVDDEVVCALATTNHIIIEKKKRKGQLKVCTLFEEIARDNKAEGKIESILELLEDYGEIPEKLRKLISNQTDMETLKVWLKKAAEVGSIKGFEKAIGI